MTEDGYTKNTSHSSDGSNKGQGTFDNRAIKAPSSLLPRLMQRLQVSQRDGRTFTTISSLLTALESVDEFVRATAIRELAQWQGNISPLLVDRLFAALSDSSWLVREAAIFTLDALQIEVSQEHQMMVLLDESEFVREAARITFAAAGSRVRARATARVAPTIRRGMREHIFHALHSIDSLFLAVQFADKRGLFMAGQYPQDDNQRTSLDEITFQQRKHRRKTLGITGAVLAVLVVVGIALSWFTVLQKMPHNATGHANATLDRPIISDTNSMNSPQINWLDNTQFAMSDPYNMTYANIYNVATHAQQQEGIFDLTASQSFSSPRYIWNTDSPYVVNGNVKPDTVPTTTSSPESFTVTVEVWNVLTDKKLVTVSYDEKATSTQVPFDQTKEPSPPSAVISPDNQLFAVGQNDGNVTVWSLSTGKKVASYKINSSPVGYVQWAADSQHLLAQSSSGLVQLWDTTRGEKISSFLPPLTKQTTYTPSGQKYVNVPASPFLSPDGKLLVAVVGTNTVDVWDAMTAKLLYTRTQIADASLYADWLSNSKELFITAISNAALHSSAQGGIDDVQVWSSDLKRMILNIPVTSQQTSFDFSPSQRYFSIADASSQDATIWDTSTGQHVTILHTGANFQVGGSGLSIVWSPDERYIATLSQGKIHKGLNNVIQIWNATTGKLVMQYHSHSNQVQQVAWSPDGKYLASVSNGDLGNVMEVWQAPH